MRTKAQAQNLSKTREHLTLMDVNGGGENTLKTEVDTSLWPSEPLKEASFDGADSGGAFPMVSRPHQRPCEVHRVVIFARTVLFFSEFASRDSRRAGRAEGLLANSYAGKIN